MTMAVSAVDVGVLYRISHESVEVCSLVPKAFVIGMVTYEVSE